MFRNSLFIALTALAGPAQAAGVCQYVSTFLCMGGQPWAMQLRQYFPGSRDAILLRGPDGRSYLYRIALGSASDAGPGGEVVASDEHGHTLKIIFQNVGNGARPATVTIGEDPLLSKSFSIQMTCRPTKSMLLQAPPAECLQAHSLTVNGIN